MMSAREEMEREPVVKVEVKEEFISPEDGELQNGSEEDLPWNMPTYDRVNEEVNATDPLLPVPGDACFCGGIVANGGQPSTSELNDQAQDTSSNSVRERIESPKRDVESKSVGVNTSPPDPIDLLFMNLASKVKTMKPFWRDMCENYVRINVEVIEKKNNMS